MGILKLFFEIFKGCILISFIFGALLLACFSPFVIVHATNQARWFWLYIPLVPALITVISVLWNS